MDENEKRIISSGDLKFKLTSDESLLNERNPNVHSFLIIQQSVDSDSEIQNLMTKGDQKNARLVQEKQIEQLKSILHLDQTGMAGILLKLAENNLVKLQNWNEESEKGMQQNYSNLKYMKGRSSFQQMQGYI